MMTGSVKLNTPSAGSVTLSPADTASNVTVTIPAATATLVDASSTQTLTNKTIASLVTTGTATFGGLIDTGSTGQIQFPATQNPSSNANTLDDYEEGTWTPNISSNNGTGTFSTKSGTYTKIGKLVTVTFMVDGGSSLAAGTTQYLSGLPFPCISSYAENMNVGQMGTNGPAIRTQQLVTLSANRSVLYVYVGGTQEGTTITYASGFATYLTNN